MRFSPINTRLNGMPKLRHIHEKTCAKSFLIFLFMILKYFTLQIYKKKLIKRTYCDIFFRKERKTDVIPFFFTQACVLFLSAIYFFWGIFRISNYKRVSFITVRIAAEMLVDGGKTKGQHTVALVCL